MNESDINERLADVQFGTSTADKFATHCLISLLRDICDTQRSGGELVRWEWDSRVLSVAIVCGFEPSGTEPLWEWCCDISGDYLLEDSDPFAQV